MARVFFVSFPRLTWIAPRAGAFGAAAVAGDVACPGARLFVASPSGGAVAVAAVTGAVAADTVGLLLPRSILFLVTSGFDLNSN